MANNVIVNFILGGNASGLQQTSNQAAKSLNQVNNAYTNTTNSTNAATIATKDFANNFLIQRLKFIAATKVITGIADGFVNLTKSLIETSAEFQRLGTSFVSILAEPLLAVSKGAAITADDLAILKEQSVSLFQDAQRAAIDTVATTQEYVKLLQAALAIGHNVGLTIGETEIITKRLALAAGAFGINFEKASTAIAQILSGSIRVTNQLGRNLGLATQEQRKQLQLSIQQGTLFEFLEKKTRNFELTSKEVANNFLNVSASIKDIFQIGGTAAIKPLFDFINKFLVQFRDTFIGEETFFTPALRKLVDGFSQFFKDILPSIRVLVEEISNLFIDIGSKTSGISSITKIILATISGIVKLIDQMVSLRGLGGVLSLIVAIRVSFAIILSLVNSIFATASIGRLSSFAGLASSLTNIVAIIGVAVLAFQAFRDSSDDAQRSFERFQNSIERFTSEQTDFKNSFKLQDIIDEYKQLQLQTERTIAQTETLTKDIILLQERLGNNFEKDIDNQDKIREAYGKGNKELRERIVQLDKLREQLEKIKQEPNIVERIFDSFKGGFAQGAGELLGGLKSDETLRIQKKIDEAKSLAKKLGPELFPAFDISSIENINKYIAAIERAMSEDIAASKSLELRTKTTEQLFDAVFKLRQAKLDGASVDSEIRTAQELIIKGLRREAEANKETAESYTERLFENQQTVLKEKEFLAARVKSQIDAANTLNKNKVVLDKAGAIIVDTSGLTKLIEANEEVEKAKDRLARLKSALSIFVKVPPPGPKGRTQEEQEAAEEFKRQLDEEKTTLKERLADFQEFQKIEVQRLASEVKAGRAPFTAAIQLDIEDSKKFLEESSKGIDALIAFIDERIKFLSDQLSSTRAAADPKFAKAISGEITKLQSESNRLIKERGKDRRKAELEIVKEEIALADLSAEADKNRLGVLNNILSAEESRLKVLQEENLIYGPDAKERDIKIQKSRLSLIEQEIALAKQRLEINLAGALSEAKRQQEEDLANQLKAGVTPEQAANLAATRGKDVLGVLLASTPIITLRNEVISLGQAASEAQLKIANADGILGRISFGFGELARLSSKFPGLELVFIGLKNFIDAIQGAKTQKSAPELIKDAGGIFKGQVKDAGQLLIEAAEIAKQRFIEAMSGTLGTSTISTSDIVSAAQSKLTVALEERTKLEEQLNAALEEDSTKAESATSDVQQATKDFFESTQKVTKAQKELAEAVTKQTKEVKDTSKKASQSIAIPGLNIQGSVQQQIAKLTEGKTLGGLPLGPLLLKLAEFESGFRPGVVGIEAANVKGPKERFGLFQFAKATVTPILKKLGKSFDDFLKSVEVQVDAVSLFLNEELSKTGTVKGAFRAFGVSDPKKGTKSVIFPLIDKLKKLITENLVDDAEELRGLLATALSDNQELSPSQVEIIKNAFEEARTKFLLEATRPRTVTDQIPNENDTDAFYAKMGLGPGGTPRFTIPPPPDDEEKNLVKTVITKTFQAASAVLQGLSADTLGGKIAGFGQLANLIPVAGPFIAAGLQIVGGFIDFFGAAAKKKTQELAAALNIGIQDIKDALSNGAIGLGEGIRELQAKLEDARRQLSGRKGGAEELKKIEADIEAEKKRLRAEAKRLQDEFRYNLDLLRQPAGLRDTITAVAKIKQTAKEFINSFENPADALAAVKETQEFIRLSIKELKDGIQKTLSDLQQNLRDATDKFASDERSILLEGRIDPRVSVAESKRQRLAALEREFQKNKLDLENQISAEQKKLDYVNQRANLEEKIAKLAERGANALGLAADKLSGAANAIERAFAQAGRFDFGTSAAPQSVTLNLKINDQPVGQTQIGVGVEQHLELAGLISPSRLNRFNQVV